jgi:uncharacterized protein
MKKVLMILGGMWHDFEGFSKVMIPVFQTAGYAVEATYDLDRLLNLEQKGIEGVISDTCFSLHREGHDDRGPEGLSDNQVSGWVAQGGGLLAVHAATVAGKSNAEYKRLLGGLFIEHPPAFTFPVFPMYNEHPIIQGIQAFTVQDEFYMEKLTTPVDVHMAAVDRGVGYPMVWSKTEGKGRVAHVAMGHGPEVWNLAPYQRLLAQALGWVCR